MLRAAAILLLALAHASGAGAQLLDCSSGQRSTQVAQLFFGRNIGNRFGVSENAWSRFVDREIVPRFPDGMTVFDATGRYRLANRVARERSKIVEIAMLLLVRSTGSVSLASLLLSFESRSRRLSS